MARQLHVFDHPQRFVAGTVGEPGERTFYLQASDGLRTISVALEKEQVKILAERLDDIVDEVTRRGDIAPIEAPPADLEPLEMPIDEEFRVSALGLAWDDNDHLIVIEAVSGEAGGIDEDSIFSDADEAPDALRVRIDAAAAKAFTARAIALVEAGRAACPLCGRPLEPTGHICPRQNGYHRAALS
ncbi:DUF3090 family protein [Epidermidibacterium keratini]|uniref:DUF3090 family protein n=1 Tax=Epidermidibacterium keratini TaxID=1891644 RepID=A0A7L4YSN6_9ACTN|nr:DUF3090 family protein [Epidermidibacterium keratini]QHC02068.1 DUF3090 family protein [Epidermidibacterium keratini]